MALVRPRVGVRCAFASNGLRINEIKPRASGAESWKWEVYPERDAVFI